MAHGRILILSVLALAIAAAPAARAADLDGDRIGDDLEARLDAAPVKVIVRLEGQPTDARLDRLTRAAGPFAVRRRLALIDSVALRLTPAQVREVAQAPGVRSVERDAPMHALNGPGRASFGVAAARSQAPGIDGDHDGSAGTYTAGDEVAAVIDTGIDAGHQDLDGDKVIGWHDFVFGDPTPYDDDGHGTHVAATLAGDGSASGGAEAGVAPRAALVGVKVLDANGNGDESTVVAGIQWVIDHRAQYGIEAINLSLGGDDCGTNTDDVSVAVNKASAAGIVVAAAAGNNGPDICTISAPGSASSAITVGAMADLNNGGFSLADFSSRGPTDDGRVKPDVLAPGVGVRSARAGSVNGYVIGDGTSMATPFVAGLGLLMKDVRQALTPAQIKSAMMRTAIDWGPGGQDIDYGAGRLDAHAALIAVGAGLGTAPAVPRHRSFFSSFGLPGTRNFALDVRSTAWPIAVTVLQSAGVGVTAAVLDPSGNVVGSTSVSQRQGGLSVKPGATGIYTLRLGSVFGGNVRADVSAGLPAPPPVRRAAVQPIALEPVVLAAARAAAKALHKVSRRKLRRRRAFRFTATVPLAGKLVVRVLNRQGTVPIARGSRTFGAAGAKRFRVRLTKRGRRYLRRHRTRKFKIEATFTDAQKRHALSTRKARLKKVASR